MSLLNYARSLAQGYYDIMMAIRIYSNQSYENSLISMGEESIIEKSERGFNDNNNSSRIFQTKECNKRRSCQYQKSLLRRINNDIRKLETGIEARIKRDFLYDNTKSRRWHKRHHVI